MNLGIAGKSALVTAASRGLGRACALALAREGVKVTIMARRADVLENTARDIAASTGNPVGIVAGDVTRDEDRRQALAVCPAPDILIANVGGAPPGNWQEWSRTDWLEAVDGTLVAPVELIRATLPGMRGRKFGRIVCITSALVKAPNLTLALGNAARSGLTNFVGALSRQVAADNVTINCLLPGPFDTDRVQVTLAATAKAEGIGVEEARARRAAANPAKRFGNPAEFGDYCAFLCSAQAGYITGQNLVIDGGNFPGML
ncbi:MAG: SDR family oxidoreductase [Rhodospirillales bacterium]|nr:SDR family oxidoreductase [Rhodospirillales bacterium]